MNFPLVMLVILFSTAAYGLLLGLMLSRRNGWSWNMLRVMVAFELIRTLGWVWLSLAHPGRYDSMPAAFWPIVVGQFGATACACALALRMKQGDR